MGRIRSVGADGLFESERWILKLKDARLSIDEIATETGLSRAYVAKTVGMYAVTAANPFDDMVRSGTAQLLRALQRHHPDQCGRTAA